ncbi:MAG: sigma factor-like helix-turn-helix DNA-binding protein, partial [bacterium]
ATILRLRYGLGKNAPDPMTLKEIGKIVGLTRERVRQIEQDSLRKLYSVMGGEDKNQDAEPKPNRTPRKK